MALRVTNHLGLRLLHEVTSGLLTPLNATGLQFVRHRITKHWNPKWKRMRKEKVIPIELPNFHEKEEDFTEEQMRQKLKERGLLPNRPWQETPHYISCTGGIFEAYVPPEGDGKVSPITAQGAKQKLQFLEKKSKTMMAIRKIRSFEEDFDTPLFCKLAEEIYIKSHECLMDDDREEKLTDYVTESVYPEIIHNVTRKTIRWKFLGNVELPRVVHARCTHVVAKENMFAQITVRFHTKQQLAIYDRFGRLMHGSEIIAKDVLEYVVFEKHIANEYGKWRIHAKIIPDWMPPREPVAMTYKVVEEPVQEKVEEVAVAQTTADGKSTSGGEESKLIPATA